MIGETERHHINDCRQGDGVQEVPTLQAHGFKGIKVSNDEAGEPEDGQQWLTKSKRQPHGDDGRQYRFGEVHQ